MLVVASITRSIKPFNVLSSLINTKAWPQKKNKKQKNKKDGQC
jgi:hypothetical protein